MPKVPKKKINYAPSYKLEIIRHTDGRAWLRRNGEIIWDDDDNAPLHAIATAVYRRFTGSKVVEVIWLLTSAKVFEVSHPQFIKPYEWDWDTGLPVVRRAA